MTPSEPKVFPIAPIGQFHARLLWSCLAIPALMILGIVGQVLWEPKDPPRSTFPLFLGGAVALVILAVFFGLGWATRRAAATTFEISEDGLRIRSPFYGRTFTRETLKLDEARVVEKQDARKFAPVISAGPMIGINLPGLCLGTYRLWNGSISLLYASFPFRGPIVYLPTIGRHALVLTPADPAEFLEELRTRTTSNH